MTYKTFETQRLLLIPTSVYDAKFMLELLNTPKYLRYIVDHKVYTIVEAEEYITKKITAQIERLGFGNYTVVRKSDKEKIGTCGLYDRPGLEGVDIGFCLLPAFERQGYAIESALKLIEVGMNEFNIDTISAITTNENISSQELIFKLGLKFMKMTRVKNIEEELMLYQIKKDKS